MPDEILKAITEGGTKTCLASVKWYFKKNQPVIAAGEGGLEEQA